MRLKSILLASACAVALPALASAADLPLRSAPPAFVPPPPVFTWTGFYIGVNAGYDFSNDSRYRNFGGTNVNNGIGGARPASIGISDDGFTGGGQIGYNYQFGGFGSGAAGLGAASFVLGLEADAAYTDIDKRVNVTNTVGGNTYLNSFRTSLDYLGTVRGRVGVAFDRVLVYGTGGLAYGNLETGANLYNPNSNLIRFHGFQSGMETGYAVGGGIEYAVPTDSFLNSLNFFHSSAVTIKAEYLYYNLGSRNLGEYPADGNGNEGYYVSRVRTDGNLARIGINYKF